MAKTSKLGFVGEYEIKLNQQIGSHCIPCVLKGDRVNVGDLIGRAIQNGANVHSPVDGVVSKVSKESVFIKPNKTQKPFLKSANTSNKVTRDIMLNKIYNAGVIDIGYENISIYDALSSDIIKDELYIIVERFDKLCQHNLTTISKQYKELIKGIKYFLKITGLKTAKILIEDKYENEVSKLISTLKNSKTITIIKYKNIEDYKNIHLIDVETILRIYEAIEYDMPVVTKNITIIDERVEEEQGKNPIVLMDIPLGVKLKSVFKLAKIDIKNLNDDIIKYDNATIINDLNEPVTKNTNTIIISGKNITKSEKSSANIENIIRENDITNNNDLVTENDVDYSKPYEFKDNADDGDIIINIDKGTNISIKYEEE